MMNPLRQNSYIHSSIVRTLRLNICKTDSILKIGFSSDSSVMRIVSPNLLTYNSGRDLKPCRVHLIATSSFVDLDILIIFDRNIHVPLCCRVVSVIHKTFIAFTNESGCLLLRQVEIGISWESGGKRSDLKKWKLGIPLIVYFHLTRRKCQELEMQSSVLHLTLENLKWLPDQKPLICELLIESEVGFSTGCNRLSCYMQILYVEKAQLQIRLPHHSINRILFFEWI